MLFLAVLGPGFITANVDNDSGGILTYSQAGAQYGYTLLWTMIPITLALIVVQEMCARMGVVTGKGLSDLIREEFGLRVTFVMMILLVLVNFANVIAEFIGIAGSLHLFHVSRFISVPICATLVWFLAVRGDYKQVEKIFLIASVVYIAYIFAGVLSQPSWHDALLATVKTPPRTAWTRDYIYMAIGVVGTTIAPWMQFYLQASIVEKGVRVKDYAASRLDVIVGSFFTDIVAWFIIVACAATLFVHGMGAIQVPADAADAMRRTGRELRLHPLRLRPLQRLALRRVDPAALHRLHRLRRPRPGIRRRQKLQGSTFLLLALHPAHRRRSHRRHGSARQPADEHSHPLASPQRRAASSSYCLNADPDQSQRPHGRTRQQPPLQRSRLGNQHHRHIEFLLSPRLSDPIYSTFVPVLLESPKTGISCNVQGGTMATLSGETAITPKSLPGCRYDHFFFSSMVVLLLATVAIGFAHTYFLAGVSAAPLRSRILHFQWRCLFPAGCSCLFKPRSCRRTESTSIGALAWLKFRSCAVGSSVWHPCCRGRAGPSRPQSAHLVPIVFNHAVFTDMLPDFAVLAGCALYARSNPSVHKRLILMAYRFQ